MGAGQLTFVHRNFGRSSAVMRLKAIDRSVRLLNRPSHGGENSDIGRPPTVRHLVELGCNVIEGCGDVTDARCPGIIARTEQNGAAFAASLSRLFGRPLVSCTLQVCRSAPFACELSPPASI